MTFDIWMKWMEASSSLQNTWDFFYKIKNTMAWLLFCLWNSYPRTYIVQNWKPYTYATCYLIELCHIVAILCEIHFIFPWSWSRTLHIYLPTSTLEVAQEHSTHSYIPSTNKTPCYSRLLSPSYHFKKKDMGYAKINKRHA